MVSIIFSLFWIIVVCILGKFNKMDQGAFNLRINILHFNTHIKEVIFGLIIGDLQYFMDTILRSKQSLKQCVILSREVWKSQYKILQEIRVAAWAEIARYLLLLLLILPIFLSRQQKKALKVALTDFSSPDKRVLSKNIFHDIL